MGVCSSSLPESLLSTMLAIVELLSSVISDDFNREWLLNGSFQQMAIFRTVFVLHSAG
jgi:hypothetical protein